MTTSARVHDEHATSTPSAPSAPSADAASPASDTALVTLHDLTVRDRAGRILLDVPALTITPGERIVLTGRSGAASRSFSASSRAGPPRRCA